MLGWLGLAAAVFQRELRGLCASPGLILSLFYGPLFWMLVIWALLGDGMVSKVPVGLVDNDKSPLSRSLCRALDANRAIALQSFPSREEALDAMRQGGLYGVIVIPADYSRASASGSGVSIVAYLDENRYAVAGTILAEIREVLSALSIEQGLSLTLAAAHSMGGAKRLVQTLSPDFLALGNMQYSFLAFLGSCLTPAVLMIGATLGFCSAILREVWQKSVSSWLGLAQGRIVPALAGKLLPYFLLYALLFLFYMALFAGQGGWRIQGQLLDWFMLGLACLAAFCAMSVLILGLAPNWRSALVIASGYAAPSLPFTGFSIPLDSMGQYVKAFAHCLPLTWFIQGQSQIWTLGAQIQELCDCFAALSLLCLLPLGLGLPLFKHKFLRLGRQENGLAP